MGRKQPDVYRVQQVLTRDGKRWQVKRDGAKRFAAAGFTTQPIAVVRGMELARKAKARLVVHRATGEVARERDFATT